MEVPDVEDYDMGVPKNARVILKKYADPYEEPTEDHFEYQKCEFPLKDNQRLLEGQVIVKSLYLSVDPAMRFSMNGPPHAVPNYPSRWTVGEVIFGLAGIGVIIRSNSARFEVRDYVFIGLSYPWQKYFVQSDDHLFKVDLNYIGGRENLVGVLTCFGYPGLTALIGIEEKGHVYGSSSDSEENQQVWVISGAAGSCGSLAGQMVLLECDEDEVEVFGICGSDDKCRFLIEIGFDEAINYKKEDVGRQLDILCPVGIDRYFDNVGGDISEAVVSRMNYYGHIILNGQISEYSKGISFPFPCSSSMQEILEERCITRETFVVFDYQHLFETKLRKLLKMYINQDLEVRPCFEFGLKRGPFAFMKMLAGKNIGKQLLRVTYF